MQLLTFEKQPASCFQTVWSKYLRFHCLTFLLNWILTGLKVEGQGFWSRSVVYFVGKTPYCSSAMMADYSKPVSFIFRKWLPCCWPCCCADWTAAWFLLFGAFRSFPWLSTYHFSCSQIWLSDFNSRLLLINNYQFGLFGVKVGSLLTPFLAFLFCPVGSCLQVDLHW